MARKRNRIKQQPFTVWHQYAMGVFILLSVVVFSILVVLEVSGNPFALSRQKAREVAGQYAGVTSISQIASYNGTETYHSVIGTNQEGQELLVLIPENTTEIMVYQLADGVSQTQAETVATANGATSIERVIAGYRDGKAIWEVKSGTSYYLVDFATGEFIIKEGL